MGTHYQGTEAEKRALNIYIKLFRAADAVTTRINQHLADVNLTVSQFGVLEALYHLGPMHQRKLGEKILKSGGNMTMVIDNLSKRGLVERKRDRHDRRFVQVHLTDAGYLLIDDLFPRHVQRVTAEINVLSEDEQAQFGYLCRKLGLGNG